MFAMQNELKQAGILRTDRSQSPIVTLASDLSGDAIQQPIRGNFQTHHCQRVQIAGVSRSTQFRAAAAISNASTQIHPSHYQLARAPTFAPDFETLGVINRG